MLQQVEAGILITMVWMIPAWITDKFTSPQMQYDTAKTFYDIHGSVDALKASVYEIENLALNRAKRVGSDIPLRFLTPLKLQPKSPGNVVHLRLTPLHEHTSASQFVAVSYTWQQPKNLEAKFKNLMPTYSIHTTAPTARPPRCPTQVLHRALLFAQEKIKGVPLLWIDQECIDQDDPADVENHLQVMHEIYQRSTFTAVILSRLINDIKYVDDLFPMKPLQALSILDFIMEDIPERWTRCLAAVEFLAQDPWFKRTWCFQERHCAGNCFYLIPVDPDIPFGGALSTKFCISHGRLLDFYKDVEQLADQDVILVFEGHRTMLRLAKLIKDHFDASKSNTHRPITYLEDKDKPRFYGDVFFGMEDCHNSIVADRIAIFANICSFRWTLNSTKLRDRRFSYSTAILVLLRMNTKGEQKKLLADDALEEIMQLTIRGVLSSLAEGCAQSVLERPFEEDEERAWAPLTTFGQTLEKVLQATGIGGYHLT